ncbi:hypothetical protein HHI36_011353 [Cryptolaemus montrouzieri]|uniref:Glycosyltransferase family 92 protein n=1 Tax=Cryptolaemus montrouzieri TaxID=559131 RepID=A0ABD2MLF0_9CUCU
MKKYQQLFLILFSLISLTLFLVYRHEYNRLHYILEVFNFFGTPCNFSELRNSEKVLEHYDWGQDPVWQEHDNYYTFSGFINESCVQVIALEVKGSKSPRKCFLWYENDGDPILGQMSSNVIANDHELQALIYICRFRSSEDLPYAVSFTSKPNYLVNKKVTLTKIENWPITIKTTVCVPPRKFSKREFVEFISFHRLIGVKYFIFYQNSIPNRLTKFLSNLAEVLDIQATFLHWNFPKFSSSVVENIIEKDCSLRTYKKSRTRVVLALNEYLIPLDSYSLLTLFDNNTYHSNFLDVPIQKICITSNDTFQPLAVQNKNILKDRELRVRKFNFNVEETKNTPHNNKFQMVINVYEYCSNLSGWRAQIQLFLDIQQI